MNIELIPEIDYRDIVKNKAKYLGVLLHGLPKMSNAGRQAPLEAAARHERRLEAVACTPLLGAARW